MIYLIVSILFITATGVTFRISTDRGADPYGMNAAYRCVGGAIAIVLGLVTVGPGLCVICPVCWYFQRLRWECSC
jgi:hypothetical protein